MEWLSAVYQPTTLFSLKPSWATSSGGKSLLLPSPYALKMAVLDVAIRIHGLQTAEHNWPIIRDLHIGVALPAQIVVSNLFAKILKLRRTPAEPGEMDAGPFQKSIGYREYVYHPQPLRLVFKAKQPTELLADWLINLNYWGKRGGFVQLQTISPVASPAGFLLLTAPPTHIPLQGLVQQLDDCDEKMKFAEANIYDAKKPKRVIRHVVLPYRITRSSRSYTLYEQITL